MKSAIHSYFWTESYGLIQGYATPAPLLLLLSLSSNLYTPFYLHHIPSHSVDDEQLDLFPVTCGLKQGCVLAPTLFALYFAEVVKEACILFPRESTLAFARMAIFSIWPDLRHALKSPMHWLHKSCMPMICAQMTCNIWCPSSTKFDQKISVKKTEVMSLDTHDCEILTIKLGEDVLKQVNKFCYLGSTITSKRDLDDEMRSTAGSVLQPQHLRSCVLRSSACKT